MEVAPLLQGVPVLVSCAAGEPVPQGYIDMDALLETASTALPEELAFVHFSDKLLYIYTSGTTGLPKAAVITSAR
ncbi:AMP-dependent synthetase/ligase [Trinorchestia longiramus]|nr:AMP-dependent synthetase/ligase [Trinorchestia longiramus]